MFRWLRVVLLGTLLHSPTAGAIEIFGLPLGEPLTLADCPTRTTAGGTVLEDVLPPNTCLSRFHNVTGYGQPVRRLTFGAKESPAWVRNWNAILLEHQGRLVGVQFFTPGLSAQQVVLDALSTKFGPPTTSDLRPFTNAMGAKFDSIEAGWQRADLKVEFNGAYDRIDRGFVSIELPAATMLLREWQSATQSQKRGL